MPINYSNNNNKNINNIKSDLDEKTQNIEANAKINFKYNIGNTNSNNFGNYFNGSYLNVKNLPQKGESYNSSSNNNKNYGSVNTYSNNSPVKIKRNLVTEFSVLPTINEYNKSADITTHIGFLSPQNDFTKKPINQHIYEKNKIYEKRNFAFTKLNIVNDIKAAYDLPLKINLKIPNAEEQETSSRYLNTNKLAFNSLKSLDVNKHFYLNENTFLNTNKNINNIVNGKDNKILINNNRIKINGLNNKKNLFNAPRLNLNLDSNIDINTDNDNTNENTLNQKKNNSHRMSSNDYILSLNKVNSKYIMSSSNNSNENSLNGNVKFPLINH